MDEERETASIFMFWTDAMFRQWEFSIILSLIPLFFMKIGGIIVHNLVMLGYVICRGMTLSELQSIGEVNLMKDEVYE